MRPAGWGGVRTIKTSPRLTLREVAAHFAAVWPDAVVSVFDHAGCYDAYRQPIRAFLDSGAFADPPWEHRELFVCADEEAAERAFAEDELDDDLRDRVATVVRSNLSKVTVHFAGRENWRAVVLDLEARLSLDRARDALACEGEACA